MENLYNILGIAPTASQDEIRKVFRSLAMRFHPDRNPDASAQKRFQAIQKAYDVLSDPAQRDEYNQRLYNRIVIDPYDEAHALWAGLFKQHGVELDQEPENL